jgi:hypothetical protein
LRYIESSDIKLPANERAYLMNYVSRMGDLKLLEVFLEAGHFSASEMAGALREAAGGGHLEVVERLLVAQADVNAAAAMSGGRTALQAAADGGHLEVIERLLAVGADVNAAAATSGGRTALQAAAGKGHLEVVERLLEVKANVNAAAATSGGRSSGRRSPGGCGEAASGKGRCHCYCCFPRRPDGTASGSRKRSSGCCREAASSKGRCQCSCCDVRRTDGTPSGSGWRSYAGCNAIEVSKHVALLILKLLLYDYKEPSTVMGWLRLSYVYSLR